MKVALHQQASWEVNRRLEPHDPSELGVYTGRFNLRFRIASDTAKGTE
jgi:hypothetical protein